jgi:thiamine monophosphate synthase
VAIGGIGPARVPEVLRAGASGIAVVRAVWSSEAPVEAAAALARTLEAAEPA